MSYLDEERGYRGDCSGPQNADFWAGYNKRLADIEADNKRQFETLFPENAAGRSSAGGSHIDGPPKSIVEMAKIGAGAFGFVFLVYAYFVYGQPGVSAWKLVGQGIVVLAAGAAFGVAWWIAIRVLKIAFIVGVWGLLFAFVYYAFGAK